MYITGTKFNLESRLHSLGTEFTGVNAFRSENLSYIYASGYREHVNKEFQHVYYEITKTGSYLTGIYVR